MATNRKNPFGRFVWLDAGAAVSSGDIVAVNNLVGIAQQDSDTNNYCTIDTAGVYDLSVKGHDGSGNSAVAIGQVVYADMANNRCDKDSSNPIAGIALEAVSSGDTATIKVLLAPGNYTDLVADAVTSAKVDPQYMKVVGTALSSGNADDFALAWQNPEDAKILVHKVIIDITAAGGTATSVLNVGSAADATTGSDNLLDGIDANAVATYDNNDEDDAGTNGKASQKVDENGGTTDYVTAQIKTANAASLAGYAYIFYTEVQ